MKRRRRRKKGKENRQTRKGDKSAAHKLTIFLTHLFCNITVCMPFVPIEINVNPDKILGFSIGESHLTEAKIFQS